jgi:methylmalonyl-CoA mutase N-terminal domain/subunit
MARVRKNKRGIVGVNWHLKLRLKIETLENLVDKLYRENQRMKRRLEKYEGTRSRVNYRNNLTETSKSSSLSSD